MSQTRVGSTYGRRDIEDRRDVLTPPAPPQPRRPGGKKAGVNGHAAEDNAQNDEGPRPTLPPRRHTDLLGDDDDDVLGGWEALKPT